MTAMNVRPRQYIPLATVGSAFDALLAVEYRRMEDVTEEAQSLYLTITLQQSVLTVEERRNKKRRL